jgi:excisionase family DNA binding protein
VTIKLAYSIDEAIEAIGLGRTTVFELMASGELESVKVGRRRLIPSEALKDYVQRLRTEQGSGGPEAA